MVAELNTLDIYFSLYLLWVQYLFMVMDVLKVDLTSHVTYKYMEVYLIVYLRNIYGVISGVNIYYIIIEA